MKLLLCMTLLIAGLGGCSYLNKQFGFVDDNPAEQAMEFLIKSYTDINVDLTPDSK